MNDIQKCVARGVEWLDEHYPGWPEKAKGMNIGSVAYDVLCRVTGYDSYDAALAKHDIDDPEYYGFDTSANYMNLQAEWDHVIEDRLAAGSTPMPLRHPFKIYDDGSVSYGADTMQGSEVLALIAKLQGTIVIDHPGSYGGFAVEFSNIKIKNLAIGCAVFSMEQIEAFIEDYEARQERKEEGETRTVQIGDIVILPSLGDYIVASIPETEAILISLERGSRWSGPAEMLDDGGNGYALSDLLGDSHFAYRAMNRIIVKPRLAR